MSEDWFYIFKELEEEKGEEGGEQIGGKGKKIKEVGDHLGTRKVRKNGASGSGSYRVKQCGVKIALGAINKREDCSQRNVKVKI